MIFMSIISKTFFIKTFGCASNIADSEYIKQILFDAKFKESNINTAKFVLINTCTVKGPTENKIKDYLKKIKLSKERIFILGCLPCDKKFISDFSQYSMINSYNINSVLDAILKVEATKKPIHILDQKYLDKTKYNYNAKNIAIVQPLIGCLGNCSFCKTKFAKPLFYSYPLKNILSRIDKHIKNGAKEIWISSEDNAAYGSDLNLSYIDLLNAIEVKFKGKAMFRFGMSNPWLINKNLDDLISFFKNTKCFYKFLHIPIQSASSSVLKSMKRPYNEKQINKIFSNLRKNFSADDLTIATDTIVGFPLESETDFKKTLNFTKKYNILINNVSQFWPMSFTEAYIMKQINNNIKKDRSRILSNFARLNYKQMLTKYINKTIEVYFNDVDEKGNYLGKTRNYISVIVPKTKQTDFVIGKWYKVKILNIENYHLMGKAI